MFKTCDSDDDEVTLVSYFLREISWWKPALETITGIGHSVVIEKQLMCLTSIINGFHHNEELLAFLKLQMTNNEF